MNHTILQTLLLNNPEIPEAVSSFCDSWPEYVQAEQGYNRAYYLFGLGLRREILEGIAG